jgi:hypothetical protein
VFFRGFRGHNIHHYQIETVLARGDIRAETRCHISHPGRITAPIRTAYERKHRNTDRAQPH